MSRITLKPGKMNGTVSLGPSKSIFHRALILASLADKPTDLLFEGTIPDDVMATMDCISALGAKIELFDGKEKKIRITPPDRTALPKQRVVLPVRESGSTLRFILPLAGVFGANIEIMGEGRVLERPLAPLVLSLEEHGYCKLEGQSKLAFSGKLNPGEYSVPGNISSQFLSGLLLSLPALEKRSSVLITGDMVSHPYLDLTRSVLSSFGICWKENNHIYTCTPGQKITSPGQYKIPSDFSSSVPFLVAAAMNGKITVSGISSRDKQPDSAILSLLSDIGARVTEGDGSITVESAPLSSFHFDCTDSPDLFPCLAILAGHAEGTSVLSGIDRLRYKESDRVAAMCNLLSSLGIAYRILSSDKMEIKGKEFFTGGQIQSTPDHRIVMAAFTASVVSSSPLTIDRIESLTKSFPGFESSFTSLIQSI